MAGIRAEEVTGRAECEPAERPAFIHDISVTLAELVSSPQTDWTAAGRKVLSV
jgi:hypothetical protein